MVEAHVLALLIPKPTTGYNPKPDPSRDQKKERKKDYLILSCPMAQEPSHPLSPDARNRSSFQNIMFEKPKMKDIAKNNNHVYSSIQFLPHSPFP